MKILIVDDIGEDRRLLRYIAERQGHVVLEAENGFEGYKVALSARPDLIISDALMPVLDGFQFLRLVRADEALKSIRFIFYSATYKGDQDVQLALALGADAYIFKPKEPKAFWQEVESVLQNRGTEPAATSVLVEEEEEYLRRYSEIVATKLEKKVRELEEAKARIEKNEAFVRKILETVDEGFIVVDRNFRILSANRAFCHFAGLSESEVLGQPCYEVSHRCPRPCFERKEECAIKQTFADGSPHSVLHVHVEHDGSQCFVEIKSYPIFDAEGQVDSAIETISDITEKKELEEQLRHAQKLEALGTMAGCVAHDFNNVLSVIMGYGEMLLKELAPGEPRLPYVREILAAGQRATQLTQSLLIFSRKQYAELKPINVNELVNGLKRMVLRLIGEDIETKINFFPGKMMVMGDYGQLEQVMLNFVTNARDVMPNGGVLTITTAEIVIDDEFIGSHGFGEPGRYALITVSDTGEGMDATTRERIFEPFFTTKEPGRGTGLGLSIVYGIVQQHQGYVNCASEKFRGTSMMVYLPLTREERLDPKKVAALHAIRGGDETILIADDDPYVRKFTKELLETYGYTVIEAKDGADTVSAFIADKEKIDLLLLDVIMPGKSGKEAFQEIRAVCPEIKALFISGYPEEVITRKKILEDGLELLQKPVPPKELLAKIRATLDGEGDPASTL